MRIAIVYNEPVDLSDNSECGVVQQAGDIEQALRDLGEVPIRYAAVNGEGLAGFLARARPEVVFNCCESLAGDAALEMSVAALFDLFGVAYTGSPALTLGLALDKSLAKAIFHAHGVPTPRSAVLRTAADLPLADALAYPLIVKPVAEDASIGVDAGAVVQDREAMAARVALMWSRFEQPAMVEEFVDGRELNVALLANADDVLETLPISEVSFDAVPAGQPRIVSFDAKWTVDSMDYRSTPVRCPAPVSHALAERVNTIAVRAARAVGLRDYGRVDVRVRASDEAVFVLEVNPNPDLSADAGFMRAVAASGGTFATTVQRILSRAAARARLRAAPPVVS